MALEITTKEFFDNLSRKFSTIKYVEKFGGSYPYVDNKDIVKRLNECFGLSWSWRITHRERFPVSDDEDFVIVEGEFSYFDENDRAFVKAGIGGDSIKRYGLNSKRAGQIIDMSNAWKAASTDALKRAVALCGVALDLTVSAEPMTEGQKQEIYKLFSKIGHEPDQTMKDAIEAFNTADAEKFIETLKAKLS